MHQDRETVRRKAGAGLAAEGAKRFRSPPKYSAEGIFRGSLRRNSLVIRKLLSKGPGDGPGYLEQARFPYELVGWARRNSQIFFGVGVREGSPFVVLWKTSISWCVLIWIAWAVGGCLPK